MVHFQSSRLSEMSLFVPHGNDIFTQSLYSQAFSIRILKMQLHRLLSSTVFDKKYEVSVIIFFFPLCTICFFILFCNLLFPQEDPGLSLCPWYSEISPQCRRYAYGIFHFSCFGLLVTFVQRIHIFH